MARCWNIRVRVLKADEVLSQLPSASIIIIVGMAAHLVGQVSIIAMPIGISMVVPCSLHMSAVALSSVGGVGAVRIVDLLVGIIAVVVVGVVVVTIGLAPVLYFGPIRLSSTFLLLFACWLKASLTLYVAAPGP